MAKPEMAMVIGKRVNAKRCRVKSEAVATIIEKTKAQAQGGTEKSCVRIGE